MGRPVFIQDLRLPGMVHGRVVRPPSYGAELTRLDDAMVRKMPGVISVVRDGRFLGVVAEREEQAIAAREALAKAATWRVPAALPDPANVHEYLKTRPGIDTKTVNEKTGAASPAVKTLEGDLSQALSRACLHRAVLRGRGLHRRDADRVVAHARALSLARRHRQGDRPAAGKGARHPHPGRGLLRPQWRGRCRARRGAALAQHQWPPGQAAMDARRRIRLGAVRLGHDDGGARGPLRRRQHCRLAI